MDAPVYCIGWDTGIDPPYWTGWDIDKDPAVGM